MLGSIMNAADPSPSSLLLNELGEIDIYLFDQLLRGRFDRRRRVLDAGCGGGRNLPFFLRHRFEIWAVDADAGAVRATAALAAALQADLPPQRLHCGSLEALPWPDAQVDAVICSAVLHFARDAQHFGSMVTEMWRVLAPSGLFFARLATSIGLESQLPAPIGRMRLPDGSERFVADERMLREWSTRLGGRFLDPLKTTNVEQRRAMTTWVLEKAG
jgi:SAM-dependent methyltransferase